MHNNPKSLLAQAALLMLALGTVALALRAAEPVATNPELRARALQETAIPVRPGVPGEQPFWNGQAVQFLYAPAFDFKEIPGAKSYRATGDRLHLEKAKALAATLTRTQSNKKAPGRYQTWVMQNPGPMWFNCELNAIRAMQELAKVAGADAGVGR